ncbi:MAG: hypothetical protein Q9218_007199, partial [Villophora microphyllina]
MASSQKPPARRRWTLNRTKAPPVESSDSSYGEEILPTIDKDAVKALPKIDRLEFIEMRNREKRNVIARWMREGKHIPATGSSTPPESTRLLLPHSPPPQLPELQMDVTKDTLSSAFQDRNLFGSRTPSDNTSIRDDVYGGGVNQTTSWNEDQYSDQLTTSAKMSHEKFTTPAKMSDNKVTIPAKMEDYKASLQSTPDTDETSQWLNVMDEAGSATRNRRRGFYGAAHASPTKDPAMNPPRDELPSGLITHNGPNFLTNTAKGESSTGQGMTLPASQTSMQSSQSQTTSEPSSTSDPSATSNPPVARLTQSERQQLIEEKALRRILEDQAILEQLDTQGAREFVRGRGIGPVPPGLALRGNAPSIEERAGARALTEKRQLRRQTGQVTAFDVLFEQSKQLAPSHSLRAACLPTQAKTIPTNLPTCKHQVDMQPLTADSRPVHQLDMQPITADSRAAHPVDVQLFTADSRAAHPMDVQLFTEESQPVHQLDTEPVTTDSLPAHQLEPRSRCTEQSKADL